MLIGRGVAGYAEFLSATCGAGEVGWTPSDEYFEIDLTLWHF
jgi:hypothetical protein